MALSMQAHRQGIRSLNGGETTADCQTSAGSLVPNHMTVNHAENSIKKQQREFWGYSRSQQAPDAFSPSTQAV